MLFPPGMPHSIEEEFIIDPFVSPALDQALGS